MFTGIIFLKIAMLLGLGAWLLIAAINNFFDPGTNQILILDMMSMEKLKSDESLIGNKSLWRAYNNKSVIRVLLKGIASAQMLIAILLIISSILTLYAGFFYLNLSSTSLLIANIALSGFCCLWLFFLCGGLWFLYWIKLPNAQMTHFILLITGILSTILINIPSL